MAGKLLWTEAEEMRQECITLKTEKDLRKQELKVRSHLHTL